MKFIRKALWPTAIVAAVLMLFGALGSAINADTVKGGVQTEKGGVVYVEVDVDSLLADAQAALTPCEGRRGQRVRPPRHLPVTPPLAATLTQLLRTRGSCRGRLK